MIAVTAAKDVKTLRAAMQGGVVHYIVKPFVFETFRERLERYAALKQRLERLGEASQGEVDHLFSLLRVEGRARLPKGISAPTLALVVDARARRVRDEVTPSTSRSAPGSAAAPRGATWSTSSRSAPSS